MASITTVPGGKSKEIVDRKLNISSGTITYIHILRKDNTSTANLAHRNFLHMFIIMLLIKYSYLTKELTPITPV